MSFFTILIFLLVIAIFLARWGALWIIRRAEVLRLVQVPNHRSSHNFPTPSGGGLGVVAVGSLAGLCLIPLFGWSVGWWILGLSAMLAILGLCDDIMHLPVKVRFGVHVLVCAVGLVVLGDLPPFLLFEYPAFRIYGWLLFGFLLVAGVWWINLFNFMDGIDGIAGMQTVFMLLAAGALAVCVQPEAAYSPILIWMLFLAASTVGFLQLNWPPARIFMGDVGSTWLAFMVFALALFSIQAGWLTYAVWIVLAAVFVTDSTVTLLTRMLLGERWYEAHCSHAYQRLSRRWQGHREIGHRAVTLLVALINVFWLAPLAWACLQWPSLSIFFILAAYLPLAAVALLQGAGRPDPAL